MLLKSAVQVQPKFVQFLICNLCPFFQSSTILVPLWFIALVFVIGLVKFYFQLSFNLKVNL